MRIPTVEAAALRAAHLPLGPLAAALPYWQLGTGKLHADRRCPRLTPQYWHTRRQPPHRTPRRATQVTEEQLCRTCCTALPGAAETHATVGQALAEVHRRTRAARAAGRTWRDVAALHVATEVAIRTLTGTAETQPALRAAADRVLTNAGITRRRAAAAQRELPQQLDGPRTPMVVAFESYEPKDVEWPREDDYVAAAASLLVVDRDQTAAYALVPAAPAWYARYQWAKPAEPTDTEQVLATALSLVDGGYAGGGRVKVWTYQMFDALARARLIHAPAAG